MSRNFTKPPEVKNGDTVFATDVNRLADASEAAHVLIESEIDNFDVNLDAKVAKAAAWAEELEDVEVEIGKYSALHHSAKAAADVVLTHADVVLTHADVVTTTAKAASATLSASNALASETLANKWAEELEDVEVTPGHYSALHYAAKANAAVHTHTNFALLETITAAYTTALDSKLAGIEAGATADQTGAEIKVLYEAELDTNAYTDAEKTKLAGIEALAEVNNISDINALDLTDAGDSALHYHATDRDRANHTGVQAATTITEDTTHRFVTDTEKSTWNSKITSVVGGTDITVDATDPLNPIVNFTGSGGLLSPSTGVKVVGNVYGGGYSYNSTVAINTFITDCYAEDGTTEIHVTTDSTLTIAGGTPAANTNYYLFVGIDGGVHKWGSDTDIGGATLLAGTWTALRRKGVVRTNSSSQIMPFIYRDRVLTFSLASECLLNSYTATPAGCSTAIDISGWVGSVAFVSHVLLGAQASGTATNPVSFGFDGTNVHNSVTAGLSIRSGDNNTDAWQKASSGGGEFMPLLTTNIYWGDGTEASTDTTRVVLHAMRLII